MLHSINDRSPVVHCITNTVSASFQASGLLAIGASSIMTNEPKDATETVEVSNALSLNIGTINKKIKKAMILAGKRANELNIPIVFDPVGAGATSYRTKVAKELLTNLKFKAIRCNYTELFTIANFTFDEQVEQGSIDDIIKIAKKVASHYGTIVAATGAIDLLSDGNLAEKIEGGSSITTKIAGAGCLLSSIVAAALTTDSDPFIATYEVLKEYKKAASMAASKSTLAGSFKLYFIDALQELSQN